MTDRHGDDRENAQAAGRGPGKRRAARPAGAQAAGGAFRARHRDRDRRWGRGARHLRLVEANLLSLLGAEADLLTVSAGSGLDGTPVPLPLTAEPMVGASASRVGDRGRLRAGRDCAAHQHGARHRHRRYLGAGRTARAARHAGRHRDDGAFLNAATARYPAGGARRGLRTDPRHRPGGRRAPRCPGRRYFTVMASCPRAASPGDRRGRACRVPRRQPAARPWRPPHGAVPAGAARSGAGGGKRVPFTANPAQPEGVQVSTPSSILAAEPPRARRSPGCSSALAG